MLEQHAGVCVDAVAQASFHGWEDHGPRAHAIVPKKKHLSQGHSKASGSAPRHQACHQHALCNGFVTAQLCRRESSLQYMPVSKKRSRGLTPPNPSANLKSPKCLGGSAPLL